MYFPQTSFVEPIKLKRLNERFERVVHCIFFQDALLFDRHSRRCNKSSVTAMFRAAHYCPSCLAGMNISVAVSNAISTLFISIKRYVSGASCYAQ